MTVTSSLGATTAEALDALRAGRRGLRKPPIDVGFETVTGTLPFELPALPESLRHRESRTSRLAHFALQPIRKQVEAALARYGTRRVALILGTSTGGIDRTERAYDQWVHGGRGDATLPDDYDYLRQHTFDAFARVVAADVGLEGPVYVVSTACSSSAKVFASARRLIELDVVDAALVGGVDALCDTTVRGFHSLGVMADEPSRPFASERPGMNVGEAGAYLLLERTSDAPLAWLRGVGETSDAFHMSSPEPTGRGARAAMEQALAEAGVDAREVQYINAHGTGTKHNDSAESVAIEALFGTDVPVVSTKAYTGHTLGACGAVEAVLCVLSMQHGFIPPALDAWPVEDGVRLALPKTMLSQPVRYAMSNAFAFGGNNCSLLLERAGS